MNDDPKFQEQIRAARSKLALVLGMMHGQMSRAGHQLDPDMPMLVGIPSDAEALVVTFRDLALASGATVYSMPDDWKDPKGGRDD